uniref:UspA domain-containing protein n=1 Tax=Arion vulgaris TaxID=1028688 RepID=A0A0B6YAI6_9EUPU
MGDHRKVLLAMDESENSAEGFEFYMKHVHKRSDHLVVLYVPEYHTVIQSPMVMTDVSVVTDLLKNEETRIKSFLELLGNKLKKAGVGGKVKSVGGNPGEVVCKVANEEKANLIVIGSRGMSTLRRTLLGGVSDYVMHHAHIPVLICKQTEQPKV